MTALANAAVRGSTAVDTCSVANAMLGCACTSHMKTAHPPPDGRHYLDRTDLVARSGGYPSAAHSSH